ncbi:hypothetical protein TVAG_109980 [Trichomonas vaginalis G3]|uniref:Uncharacterized protein n=1 Tax=Trichomonas vaginalis (strain ATCC PRA-98 / G3) TaxID=412133 RepID=A2DGJ9_TRIV3|nr:protein ubiquitination [Trichomonas vaginalis G3]EAY20386.1 hypothetical protein TVAG_109980 [Trichomonas vaginalis G3]KAI5490566.1 protein ubiquitination [Trichomonas vaginalis G3]|eukprot:XP_001581372.1 hypothetical protein [Trichomonas vaginalis G3]
MSQGIIQNFEYIAAHICDYIKENNFFDVFEIEDIKKILKISNLTTNDFIALVQQSHQTIKANELYICIRNTNISIQNMEDVISVLKSLKKYMKLEMLNGVIDFLDHKEKETSDQNEINEENARLRAEIDEDDNKQKEIISKIAELKNSDDFERVYNFLDELSSQENQKMMLRACEEGLWKKKISSGSLNRAERNILLMACQRGNLKLVKSLIEYGCDKDMQDKYKATPIILASWNPNPEIVKFLISVGANKEAKDNMGRTALIWASFFDNLEVVKYLISVGCNKGAIDNKGTTVLTAAKTKVRNYLISELGMKSD